MNVLHLVSCRGWSSDAYWAATISAELERAGHAVTLVCRRGSEQRVIDRARACGARRIEMLDFAGGVRPIANLSDLRRLRLWLDGADVVHAHRGKEHWLAAMANRARRTPKPLVRTRHIVQPIRPHALNRWLYRRATSLVVTVTDAIRRQCIAGGLVAPGRVVALPGGADLRRFHPSLDGAATRRALGVAPDVPLIGLVSGFRVMKGHDVAIEALARLARAGRRFRALFVGQGALEPRIRRAIGAADLENVITVAASVTDLPSMMAAFDVALYPVIESDGMSRVLFEYLAMGKPVIASRVGVVPEILNDDATALLVAAGEVEALTSAIDRLLEDPSLRGRLGTAGARLARERVSGEQVAGALAGRYAELVGEAR